MIDKLIPTPALGGLDLQQLGSVLGHRVGSVRPAGHGPLYADVSQGLVERHQLWVEVHERQSAGAATQPPWILAGRGGNGAAEQGVRLQGGVQEGVVFLKRDGSRAAHHKRAGQPPVQPAIPVKISWTKLSENLY